MPTRVQHRFVSTVPDIGDSTQVLASDWNQDHFVGEVYTNGTGVTLSVGDVVRLSTTADETVVIDDTPGALGPFVVCLGSRSGRTVGSVPPGSAGWFAATGTHSTLVNGAVARGNYLRKSAASRALEDTGVSSVGAAPPLGALGIALAAAAGPGLTIIPVQWGVGGGGGGTTRLFLPATAANSPGGTTLSLVDAPAETFYELVFPDAILTEATFELPAVPIAQVVVVWRTEATTGDVKFAVELREKGDGDTMGGGPLVAWVPLIDTAKAVSWQLNETTGSVTYSPGANKRLVLLRLLRMGADAEDTLASDARVLFLQVS